MRASPGWKDSGLVTTAEDSRTTTATGEVTPALPLALPKRLASASCSSFEPG